MRELAEVSNLSSGITLLVEEVLALLIISLLQQILPFRIQDVYLLNMKPSLQRVYDFAKPLMTKKLMERVSETSTVLATLFTRMINRPPNKQLYMQQVVNSFM